MSYGPICTDNIYVYNYTIFFEIEILKKKKDGVHMRSKSIKLISLIAVLLLSVILVAVLIKPAPNQEISKETDDLIIANLDVGKADSAFVEYHGICGIIDTGTKDSYSTIKEFLDDNGTDTIDFLVITHYDKDHVGSAVKLLNNFDIEKIYLADYVSSKSGYSKLLEAIDGRDNVFFISSPTNIAIDDLSMDILPSDNPSALISDADNMDNNMSLLCMITLGEKRFLFAGDIEKDRISQILDSGTDLKADWCKLPHHGAYEDNISDFLSMVDPDYSVVSTGPERPMDNRLLTILNQMKIQNYNTMGGTVITTCDGKDITIRYIN